MEEKETQQLPDRPLFLDRGGWRVSSQKGLLQDLTHPLWTLWA